MLSKLLSKLSVRNDAIENFMSGLGTSEDSSLAGKPSLRTRLTTSELDRLYLTSDLARRIVEELVDDVMRQGWEVLDPETKEPIEALEETEQELRFRDKLRQALYNSRHYGGGAVALIYPSDDYSTELDENAGAPVGVMALDPYECQPSDWDDDATSPRFGEPNQYYVSPNNSSGQTLHTSPAFHHSRLLIFKGAPLPSRLEHLNEDWGDSILQHCWDPIRNFESSENAIANLIQRFEIATYSIEGLSDIMDEEEGRKNLLHRMKLIQQTVSMVRAVIIDKSAGEDYSRQYASVNGLDTLWDRLAHSVAKAARMPMTQLFGMSPSGLATDDQSGRANWRKQIASFQARLKPELKKFYRLLHGSEVEIRFLPQDEATAREEAEIRKLDAETRKLYVDMTAASPDEFRKLMVEEGLIENAEMDEDLLGIPISEEPPDPMAEAFGADDDGLDQIEPEGEPDSSETDAL